MSRKEIIQGTAILTTTGIITRCMGFFYRIYLSRTFGEENVGIYQLVFPVFTFCYAASSAGIETALSRAVARRKAANKTRECPVLFWVAITISMVISLFLLIFVQANADYIANVILKENRCIQMLVILSYSIPLASIHGCVCGYYYGLKDTQIPAASQLIEQITRIGSVYIITMCALSRTGTVSITYAVFGLVLGELSAAFFSFHFICKRFEKHTIIPQITLIRPCCSEILKLSVPLTANRMLLTALQSMESVSIPAELQKYGHSADTSLSIYGVLTGMAMPCIFFPTAITNAAAVMLLPTVAELQAAEANRKIKELVRNTLIICVGLGSVFCVFYLMTANIIGNVFFKSPLAARFILNLAFICPFLYANSAMISMINGMGMATRTFIISITGILIRIFCIQNFMSKIGISSYLYGILISQIVVFLLAFATLKKSIQI